MSYRCIFTVLTDTALIDETLARAIATAEAHQAHLDVLCLGVDRSQTGYFYAGASAVVLQETIARAQTEAEEIERLARKRLGASTIRWAVETGVTQLADITRQIAARARFADLVIMPQPYCEGRGIELEAAIEAALFDARTPVLVAPEGSSPIPAPKRIILGWNESTEALVAARAALPMLRTAETVHVVVIDPPQHGPDRSDPGGHLSQYLARHGVRTEIDVLSRTMPRVSDLILRHVRDMDADLVVMGAYGTSRFREAIFGGATRDMLDQGAVPVFLAH